MSPGLIIVQKAFLVVLFSGDLIFGGAYYWKEFSTSKWVGLVNKNSLKHYENTLKQLSLKGSYSGRLIIGRIFASEILVGGGGLIFGRAYLFLGGGGETYYLNFMVL